MDLSKNLKALGEGTVTKYNFDAPDAAILETFANPASLSTLNPSKGTMNVKITCPEFTSLCPKTGQPDFATIEIEYCPDQKCVESKSLKLYLMGYRNHGSFHEACVVQIGNDLVEALSPRWLVVRGNFTPRGGIPFWPAFEYHKDGSFDV